MTACASLAGKSGSSCSFKHPPVNRSDKQLDDEARICVLRRFSAIYGLLHNLGR